MYNCYPFQLPNVNKCRTLTFWFEILKLTTFSKTWLHPASISASSRTYRRGPRTSTHHKSHVSDVLLEKSIFVSACGLNLSTSFQLKGTRLRCPIQSPTRQS